jgi:hypothetical protein
MQENGEDDLGGENDVRLEASISTDDAFMRRACAKCGLHFKTEASPDQFASILQPMVSRATRDYGLSGEADDEGDEEAVGLHCPYCCERTPAATAHTEETYAYVKRLIYREVVMPMIRNAFGGLRNSRSSFVSITYEKGTLPPRPIHGPEPPDMLEVRFLCCSKSAKILPEWLGTITCPSCGTPTITW